MNQAPPDIPNNPAEGGWFATRNTTPGWVNGAIFRLIFAVVGLVTVWWLVRRLSSLLLIVFISIFLSFAIEPAVNSFERRGVRRGLGTGLVFLLTIRSLTSMPLIEQRRPGSTFAIRCPQMGQGRYIAKQQHYTVAA